MNRAAFRKFEFFEFDVITQNLSSAIVRFETENNIHSNHYINYFLGMYFRAVFQLVQLQKADCLFLVTNWEILFLLIAT